MASARISVLLPHHRNHRPGTMAGHRRQQNAAVTQHQPGRVQHHGWIKRPHGPELKQAQRRSVQAQRRHAPVVARRISARGFRLGQGRGWAAEHGAAERGIGVTGVLVVERGDAATEVVPPRPARGWEWPRQGRRQAKVFGQRLGRWLHSVRTGRRSSVTGQDHPARERDDRHADEAAGRACGQAQARHHAGH